MFKQLSLKSSSTDVTWTETKLFTFTGLKQECVREMHDNIIDLKSRKLCLPSSDLVFQHFTLRLDSVTLKGEKSILAETENKFHLAYCTFY